MLNAYETGRFRHVLGTHPLLEAALDRFPKTPPLDLADASYWSWHDITGQGEIAGSDPLADAETPEERAAIEAAIEDAYTADRRSTWR